MPLAVGVASLALTGYQMYSQNRAANQASTQALTNANLLAQNQLDVANYNADTIDRVAKANADSLMATANYNSRVQQAEEAQVGIDSAANIQAMRRDARTYLSRQRSAFAGSGVRVDTGSPLAVSVATAGQLALQRAETYRQSVAKQAGMAAQRQAQLTQAQSQANLGLYEAGSRSALTRYEGQKQAQATLISGGAASDAYHRQGTAALLNGASRMLATGYDLYSGGAFGGYSASPSVNPKTPTANNTFDFSGPITTGAFA